MFEVNAQSLHGEIKTLGQWYEPLDPDLPGTDGRQGIYLLAQRPVGCGHVGEHDAHVRASRRITPTHLIVG